MKAEERKEKILDLILRDIDTFDKLSKELGVSAATMQRDIAELMKKRQIARTDDDSLVVLPSQSGRLLHDRYKKAYGQKVAIARAAARYVADGDTLILDAGSTTCLFAREIRSRLDLTVVTNGLATANVLAGVRNIELVVLGGTARHHSGGLTGPMAEQALRRMTADRTFVSADGVMMGYGLCETSVSQAWLKELMIQRSQEIYVLADSSKLGYAHAKAWSPLQRPWTLVTDSKARPDQIAPFLSSSNVTVIIAE